MLCFRVLALVNNFISMAGIATLPFLTSEMLEQKYFHSIIMVFVRNISYRNIFLYLILPSTIYKYDRKCYLHLRCSPIHKKRKERKSLKFFIIEIKFFKWNRKLKFVDFINLFWNSIIIFVSIKYFRCSII